MAAQAAVLVSVVLHQPWAVQVTHQAHHLHRVTTAVMKAQAAAVLVVVAHLAQVQTQQQAAAQLILFQDHRLLIAQAVAVQVQQAAVTHLLQWLLIVA
jgi:hypothetical protein